MVNVSSDGEVASGGAPKLVALASVVGLAKHPERERLALWYARQIVAGMVGVYGLRSRGWGWAEGEPEPIPAAELAGLLIDWSDGTAVAWEADSHIARPAWEGLCIARAEARSDVPATDAEALATDALCVAFTDAHRLVRRWRELAALPPGWWLPEGEFWQAQPDARPDWREAERYVVDALEEGGSGRSCR